MNTKTNNHKPAGNLPGKPLETIDNINNLAGKTEELRDMVTAFEVAYKNFPYQLTGHEIGNVFTNLGRQLEAILTEFETLKENLNRVN